MQTKLGPHQPSHMEVDNHSRARRRNWHSDFEGVINAKSTVAEEVIAVAEDLSSTDAAEVTREEVERAVSKLKKGKVGRDEIAREMVKNGGQTMIDWL